MWQSNRFWYVSNLVLVAILGGLATSAASAQTYEPYGVISPARSRAALLHNRLTGQKVPIDAKILKDMEVLIVADNEMGAAHLATQESAFYAHTVRLLGSRLSNRPGNNRAGMNDVTASVIGFAKDDLDARELLSASYLYRFQLVAGAPVGLPVNVVNDVLSSTTHYDFMDNQLALNPNMDLRTYLVQAPQQIANDANVAVAHPDAAGILTSRAFLSDCADAGTNRRCYQKVVNLLTCHSLEEVANSSLPDDRVGQDLRI